MKRVVIEVAENRVNRVVRVKNPLDSAVAVLTAVDVFDRSVTVADTFDTD